MKTHYLQVCIATSPKASQPKIRQQYLATRMRNEGAVVDSDRQRQAGLLGPVPQLIGQQLVCEFLVLRVAVGQELHGCKRE